jgi:sulfatase maturation enzyme AslB (radical SAM superfamily)
MTKLMIKLTISAALISLACGVAIAEKNNGSGSAEDIASVCLAAANVCTTTCDVNPTGGSRSFSEGLSNALNCNDKCAANYGKCVGNVALRSQQGKLKLNRSEVLEAQ